jgi:hypothetical protein
MGFMEYASFLDSYKHVMASTTIFFGNIMRHHDNFEK